jgi:hypothetical protein
MGAAGGRRWSLPISVVGVIALLAAHGLILRAIVSYAGLSRAAVAVLVLIVIVKHLGLLAPAWAALRVHFHRRGD